MASAGLDADLTVTLTDTSHPSSNARRLLRVTRENPIIRLGRASKTQAKGRVAAENNALFDSPVMSRDHAELVADVESKTLAVRDIGSTHGTFLNGSMDPISRNDMHTVKDGDKLRFGVSINRDRDAFTPITVELGLEFANRCAPVTFEVPDDSEMEEDTQADHVDLTQQPETDVVDLTLEPAFPNSSRRPIDLTSEPDRSPSPERPSEHTERHASGCNLDLDAITSIDESAPISTSFPDISPIHEGEPESSIVLSDVDENVVYAEVSEIDSQDGMQSEDDDSDMESVLESDMDNMESEMATSSDEDGSDLDSNAEDSGSEIHDLFLWGEEDSDIDNPESDDDRIGGGYVPFSFSPILADPVPAPPPVEACGVTSVSQAVPPYGVATAPVTTVSASIALREPSPSDAALIFRKPMAPPTPALPAPAPSAPAPSAPASSAPAQSAPAPIAPAQSAPAPSAPAPSAPAPSAPAQSAPAPAPLATAPLAQVPPPSNLPHTREEFLAARQENKEQLAGFLSQTKRRRAPLYSPNMDSNGQNSVATIRQLLVGQLEPLPLPTHPTGPFSALLNDQSVNSAYTYEKKKQHLAVEQQSTTEEQPKGSPKRKAAEISQTSQEELGAMGCRTSAQDQKHQNHPAQDEPEALRTSSVVSAIPVLQQTDTTLDESRPTKRLRRFASSVGIAALGGITVGAVVFGSLAATCPAF